MGNHRSCVVSLIGRPNVGKSSIYNRLMRKAFKTMTYDQPGVTRDRHYGKAEWNGREFSVIDTGGYVKGSTDIFESEIRKQVELAIDEANVILFIVDVKSGVTDLDLAVVKLLRKSNKHKHPLEPVYFCIYHPNLGQGHWYQTISLPSG